MVLVRRRAEQATRHVLRSEDRDHTRKHGGARAIDADDAGMGVRRAQHFQMQQPDQSRIVGGNVHGVAGAAGDDRFPQRVAQAGAAGVAGRVLLGLADSGDRVGDRAIAGAATEIAFEGVRQVGQLRRVERGRRHDHAGGAEAALEALRVEKAALHLVQLAGLAESLDRGDLPPGSAEGGHQAGMHRLAIEPYRASAAIAGVAAFLHAERALLAQIGSQALARAGRGRGGPPVDETGG